MKYEAITWEYGITAENEKCAFACVKCIPPLLKRIFLFKKIFEINCYIEYEEYSTRWYNADTGEFLNDELKCFLSSYKEYLDLKNKQEQVLERIKNAKKEI